MERKLLNVAHASRALYRRCCCHDLLWWQHCDCGSGDDLQTSQSTETNGYIFLRFESSSSKYINMALRFIPIDCDGCSAVHQSKKNNEIEILNIHPLLLKVLLRSSNLVRQYSNKRSESGKSDDTNEPFASKHPVFVSSYDDFPNGMTGWLEQMNVEETGIPGDADECHTMIHLSYICSNTCRGRRYYSSIRSLDDDARTQGMESLAQILVGEVITEGGILCLSLEKNDGVEMASEMGYGEQHQDILFFMVEKIAMKDKRSTPAKNAKFFRLWPHGSFEISLHSTNTDDCNSGDGRSGISRTSLNPNIHGVHHSCPGYASILEELLTLARLENPDGAPTAVVLSGCSGVGKSRMASWFAEELMCELASSHQALKVSTVSARDILLHEATSSFEQNKVLDEIKATGCSYKLLIVDDLDAVLVNADEPGSSSIGSAPESEKFSALNSIVKLLDGAISGFPSRCFILGISRASWAQLPLQLARVSRFEKVVTMPPPTLGQRRDIFRFWLSTLPLLDSTVSRWAEVLAPRTAGCVASDIRRICADALTSAASRVPRTSTMDSRYKECTVNREDIQEAARICIPSQLSSMDVIPATSGYGLGDNERPIDTKQEFDLAWKDFGGYGAEKKRLYRAVVRPWKYLIMETAAISNNPHNESQKSSLEATLGISKPSGVLFHGPPGVGKTFAALCLASSLGIRCVKVRTSEIFNQWLGGSEATLRSIFNRARAASPCILFFDEFDSLATNREGGDSEVTPGVQSRILTTLLNEMDGITNVGGNQGVLIVAATNRLEAVDAALLRPGRLEEHVLLSYPKSSCIQEILKIQTAKMPLDESLDLIKLSDMFALSEVSCADIEGICRDACLIAMRRCSEKGEPKKLYLTFSDFNEGFHRIKRKNLV